MYCFNSSGSSVIIKKIRSGTGAPSAGKSGKKPPYGIDRARMETDYDMKVLVVDDSLVMRRIIINHLRSLGYTQILEADSGEKALTILAQEGADLILSDWCMRGMHGIEVLRSVRSNESTRNTPFIMVTAEAQPHLILEAIRAQVSDYVVKPFTRENLRESIDKVLALGQVGG